MDRHDFPNSRAAGPTAPAEGLYLVEVLYPGDPGAEAVDGRDRTAR